MNNKERMVLWTINQLKASEGDFVTIAEKQKQRSLTWYKANKDKFTLDGTLPRQAYTLVLLKYMGINPEEVPVVYENERQIIWHSFNFCPYLEACKKLNLNTRVVM